MRVLQPVSNALNLALATRLSWAHVASLRRVGINAVGALSVFGGKADITRRCDVRFWTQNGHSVFNEAHLNSRPPAFSAAEISRNRTK